MLTNRRITVVSAIILGAFIFAASLAAAEKAKEIKWLTDFTKAQKEAAKAKKPIMVDFATDWCGWCKKLDKDVYTDARIIDLSKKFVCVKIDGDKDKGLVTKYKIEGYPTIIFFNKGAKEVDRVVGYEKADDFLKSMKSALDKAKK